jgi:hypothetical protein
LEADCVVKIEPTLCLEFFNQRQQFHLYPRTPLQRIIDGPFGFGRANEVDCFCYRHLPHNVVAPRRADADFQRRTGVTGKFRGFRSLKKTSNFIRSYVIASADIDDAEPAASPSAPAGCHAPPDILEPTV